MASCLPRPRSAQLSPPRFGWMFWRCMTALTKRGPTMSSARPAIEATLAVPTVEVAPSWGVVLDSASPA